MKRIEIKLCPQTYKEYSLQKTSLVEDIQLLWQGAGTPWSHSLIMEKKRVINKVYRKKVLHEFVLHVYETYHKSLK